MREEGGGRRVKRGEEDMVRNQRSGYLFWNVVCWHTERLACGPNEMQHRCCHSDLCTKEFSDYPLYNILENEK